MYLLIDWSLLFTLLLGQPTELPDSLEDAANRAAQACSEFASYAGPLARCRVDFDTSVGDETYTLLKSSTEFMQTFTTSLCYLMIPNLQVMRLNEMKKLAEAKAELRSLEEDDIDNAGNDDENNDNKKSMDQRREELRQLIRMEGRDKSSVYTGPIARIYFPDEGSAALARRDWRVPPCVQFSSCGGVQVQNVGNDELIFFFCPRASESDSVEKLLQLSERTSEQLKLVIFVNPNLVDMGVTGFGMAGRMLRERLIDPLVSTYYLRTLSWGALTRLWPRRFSVWQEDDDADGGYRLIASLDRLPSNPEVEDIYDIENGLMQGKGSGGGFLDQLGDFVNGMMKL
jgi:Domain of unknown function (DUF1995)